VTSVLHIITTIKRGGAENQLLVLVKEQVRSGFAVHIAYLKDEPELSREFESAGANVHHSIANIKPFKQPLRLRKLLKNEISIVHAHLPRAELVALLCPSRFKLISSRHNAEPFFPKAPKFVSNFLSRLVSTRAHAIIAISSAVRDFLIERGEIKDKTKIKVVLYGYIRNSGSSRKRINQSNIMIGIGTVSRLTDQKDIPTMLGAFGKYLEIIPNAKLSIVGSGHLEQPLNIMAAKMFPAETVTFLGRSDRIYDFMSGLDVFILTSKYEGFGMVLLEAMDAGVPIVASRNSAIPEVLGSDFPGLCRTGDSADFSMKISLLNDFEYRKMVLEKQEKRLGMFDSKSMAENVSLIYLN
jgi:glycosyltransferase involved in cell wall biosynthesis